MDNNKELVRNFIVDNFLFGDGEKLKIDTSLFEKGIIDSTGVLELVAFIEENYKITVTDEELVQDNFSSLTAIEKFLQSKNNHAASIQCVE
jgi:acyl carrier protein